MQPSFPSPISCYMTSSLGHAEVPQAVLLTICSWSPVSHVILVHITKTLFMSHSKVHLIHSYSICFFPSVSKLTIVCRDSFLSRLLFFCILFPAFCLFISFTHNLCFLNLTISFSFLSYSHLTLTALFFFFFSISICHVCVSVPILFLSSIPRGSYIQRLQSFLLHQHFCCSQAVSCCFVMFGGKVPLKCCRASSQRERQVCVHMGDGGVLNSPLCAF